MYYWPEEAETNLTVVVGTKRYTLPKNKVYILPRNTSVNIDITLPREGTVIDDKPAVLSFDGSEHDLQITGGEADEGRRIPTRRTR